VFAINHAAAALLVRRRYPDVSLVPILIAVQAMELLWVGLNYFGVERTTTESVVRYVGDIHLTYMPFSHSLATMVGVAALAWVIGTLAGRPRLGAAVGLGIASHLLLDLVTHDQDIALAPGLDGPEYGTRLYSRLPVAAFLLEVGFGLFCWWVYRGGRALLTVIVGFNLANLSLFFVEVPGPEQFFADRPILLTTTILAQIIVTLFAVWWGARRSSSPPAPPIKRSSATLIKQAHSGAPAGSRITGADQFKR
jgi:membrane-bound metal-dependent hydrolase YbcI (DUF457 family)